MFYMYHSDKPIAQHLVMPVPILLPLSSNISLVRMSVSCFLLFSTTLHIWNVMLGCWLCGCLHCEGYQHIPLKDHAVLEDARNDGTTNLQNVGHCLSSERASHLKRHEDSSYVELFSLFLWPSGFIKGRELLTWLDKLCRRTLLHAVQFILFLQIAILNYKNFSKSSSSKFPMMKVNVMLSLYLPCRHAGLVEV